MANRTVAAVFDRYEDAAAAVSKLEAAGVAHSDISIVSNDAAQRGRYDTATGTTRDYDATSTGAGTGASVGTAVGAGAGLLAGLGLLAIPGLGPVVAAGWLVSTLVGAGAGAAAGGLLGSLTGAGIDETDAHTYAEAVHRGGTLVTVRASDANHDRVVGILDTDGTVDLGQRESTWRSEGWTGRYAGGSSTAGESVGGAVAGAASAVGHAAARAGDKVADAASSAGAELGLTNPGTDRYSATPTTTGSGTLSGRPRVRSYPL